MNADNYPLPLPLDVTQQDHLRQIRMNGCVIASPGSLRFEELEHLVDQGLLRVTPCPEAVGVHQFEITRKGSEAIA